MYVATPPRNRISIFNVASNSYCCSDEQMMPELLSKAFSMKAKWYKLILKAPYYYKEPYVT